VPTNELAKVALGEPPDLGDFGKGEVAFGCGHAILQKGASHDPEQGRHKALSVVRKRPAPSPQETA